MKQSRLEDVAPAHGEELLKVLGSQRHGELLLPQRQASGQQPAAVLVEEGPRHGGALATSKQAHFGWEKPSAIRTPIRVS